MNVLSRMFHVTRLKLAVQRPPKAHVQKLIGQGLGKAVFPHLAELSAKPVATAKRPLFAFIPVPAENVPANPGNQEKALGQPSSEGLGEDAPPFIHSRKTIQAGHEAPPSQPAATSGLGEGDLQSGPGVEDTPPGLIPAAPTDEADEVQPAETPGSVPGAAATQVPALPAVASSPTVEPSPSAPVQVARNTETAAPQPLTANAWAELDSQPQALAVASVEPGIHRPGHLRPTVAGAVAEAPLAAAVPQVSQPAKGRQLDSLVKPLLPGRPAEGAPQATAGLVVNRQTAMASRAIWQPLRQGAIRPYPKLAKGGADQPTLSAEGVSLAPPVSFARTGSEPVGKTLLQGQAGQAEIPRHPAPPNAARQAPLAQVRVIQQQAMPTVSTEAAIPAALQQLAVLGARHLQGRLPELRPDPGQPSRLGRRRLPKEAARHGAQLAAEVGDGQRAREGGRLTQPQILPDMRRPQPAATRATGDARQGIAGSAPATSAPEVEAVSGERVAAGMSTQKLAGRLPEFSLASEPQSTRQQPVVLEWRQLRAELPQVARQCLQPTNLQPQPGDSAPLQRLTVECQLDGRSNVQLSLQASGGRLTINLLDLSPDLRHSFQSFQQGLQQDLQRLGFTEVTYQFGGSPDDSQQHHGGQQRSDDQPQQQSEQRGSFGEALDAERGEP